MELSGFDGRPIARPSARRHGAGFFVEDPGCGALRSDQPTHRKYLRGSTLYCTFATIES
jgi:hypothetical protein